MVKNEQLEALLEDAKERIKEVFDSDNYKNYLSTMSKFHNYSARNTLLIWMQKPNASLVAGYAAWKKNFNRFVKQGEKGIQIIGYRNQVVDKYKKVRGDDNKPILDEYGNEVLETVSYNVKRYFPVHVFDLSQTDGQPLPQLTHELDGSVKGYQDILQAIKDVSPFDIVFIDIKSGAKGYCDFDNKIIAIKDGMSEVQNVKTAMHELVHSYLHDPFDKDNKKDSRTKEVEAESTAFMICNYYGIDTSDYSFPYIAGWSNGRELDELQNSLEVIQNSGKDLINKLDERLKEIKLVVEKKNIYDQAYAVKLADKYISVQVRDDGAFDYTIYNDDFSEFDGGIYDDVTANLENAVTNIINDTKMELNILANPKPYDYDMLQEQVDEYEEKQLNNNAMVLS